MKIPQITIHGRFQPPLHINHNNYVMDAFNRAEKVIILITNPYLDEKNVKEANHRNNEENNPFTYKERVEIFKNYFNEIGISPDRYKFKPFDITNEKKWNNVLNKNTPNLVNVYGDWSEAKVELFRKNGFEVIRTDNPKEINISGTDIRRIIRKNTHGEEKRKELIKAGYIPKAVDGLFKILNK
ncbi:hypothetical protein ACFL05_00145 [Patescibacteria group bacterium]